MDVAFLDPAKSELLEAIDYYNRESEGLGYKFAAEVRRTIGRIIHHHEAWTPLSPRTRRCRTNRFPFGVIYQLRGKTVPIVAVMHLHKHPESWKYRLSPKER